MDEEVINILFDVCDTDAYCSVLYDTVTSITSFAYRFNWMLIHDSSTVTNKDNSLQEILKTLTNASEEISEEFRNDLILYLLNNNNVCNSNQVFDFEKQECVCRIGSVCNTYDKTMTYSIGLILLLIFSLFILIVLFHMMRMLSHIEHRKMKSYAQFTSDGVDTDDDVVALMEFN